MIFSSTSRRNDASKVLDKTGYTLEQLIMFTGVDVIHDLGDVVRYAKIEVEWFKPFVTIRIATQILYVEVVISTATLNRYVEILHLVIQHSHARLGLGTKLFCKQVTQLKKYNFQRIVGLANGGAGAGVKGNGFITAALWGMSMNSSSEERYYALLSDYGVQLMHLYELLRQDMVMVCEDDKQIKMSGWEFWSKYGIDWYGEFDLNERSENMRRLGLYTIDKQVVPIRRKLSAKRRRDNE